MPKRNSTRLTKKIVEGVPAGGFAWDTELPGFGVRGMKGRKSYILQFRTREGSQGRITIASFPAQTVEEARALARIELGRLADGKNPSDERRSIRKAETLNDIAEHYLGPYADAKQLRPSTINNTKIVMKRALASMGCKPLSEFTPSDIRKLQAQEVNAGIQRGNAGTNQANKLIIALSRMFSIAMEDGIINSNPCRYVKKYPVDERWRHLSETEVSSLLRVLNYYPDQNAANAIRLLLFTGARLQEVVKSRWSQFDLAQGIWQRKSSHTKSHKLHRIALSNETTKMLIAMYECRLDDIFLFPGRRKMNSKGEFISHPRWDLNRPWKWALKEAGINDARCHDLRRTTASFVLSDGGTLAVVGKILGHTQPITTARYAHLSMDVQFDALSKSVSRMSKLAQEN